jgi:hypothetical protein
MVELRPRRVVFHDRKGRQPLTEFRWYVAHFEPQDYLGLARHDQPPAIGGQIASASHR